MINRRLRRVSAVVPATAMLLGLFAAPVAAQTESTTEGDTTDLTVIDEGVGDADVVNISPVVASVAPGDSQWVAIQWTAFNADARELRVTAVGSDGIEVSYPAWPVDGYSSGYWDDTLSVAEIDFTALKLTVAPDAVGPRYLDVTVSWVSDTGPHSKTVTMPFDEDVVDGGTGSGGTGDGGTGESTTTTEAPTTTEATTAPSTTAPSTTAPSTTAPSTTAPSTAPSTSTTTPAPALAACDMMRIDSFLQTPWTFTFQIRNRTSKTLDFEFHVPDVNYSLASVVFNGSGRNVTLTQNDDGVVIAGTVRGYQSVGGAQFNGFYGLLDPTSGDPYILCAEA